MNDFLSAIRADLTSRRMLPLLAIVCAALIAAVAYTVIGAINSGGSGSAQVPGVTEPGPGAGMDLTAAAPSDGVSETVDGARGQHGASSHDPFAAVPGTKTASTPSTSVASAVSSPSTTPNLGSVSGSTSPSGSAATAPGASSPAPEIPDDTAPAPATTRGEPAPAPHTRSHREKSGHHGRGAVKPAAKTPVRPSAIFTVSLSVQESQAEAAAPAAPETTTTPAPATPAPSAPSNLDGLVRGSEVPSTGSPLLVFAGVLEGTQAAIFEIVGEALPADTSKCLPESLQCEALRLSPGDREELQYTSAGQARVYTVELTSIAQSEAGSGAGTTGARAKGGLALLSQYGLPEGLRYSRARGVIRQAKH